MTRDFISSVSVNSKTSSLLRAATRSWRSARDSGRPVQAALYRALDAHRSGLLAPVFASLIELYESCLGRPIRVGSSHPASLSTDEHRLLGLLDGSRDIKTMMLDAARSGLGRAMRIAVQSTRVMMRLALESVGEFAPLAASRYRPALVR